jgi:hypothetical protein
MAKVVVLLKAFLHPSSTTIMKGQSDIILILMPHMINRFQNDLLDGTIALTC